MCLVDGGHKGKPTEQPSTTAKHQAYTYQRTDLGTWELFPKQRSSYLFIFSWRSCKTTGKVRKLEILSWRQETHEVTVPRLVCLPLVTLGVTVVFFMSGVAVVCAVCAGRSFLLRGWSAWVNLGARPWKKFGEIFIFLSLVTWLR